MESQQRSPILYPHVVQYVRETPWAILPGTLVVILDLLAFRAEGGRLTAEEVRERIGAVVPRAYGLRGNVAIIPIRGVIAHRMGMLAESSGGTSIEALTQQFRDALVDPNVGGIVFDVDSPGGTVQGIEELALEIHGSRSRKPILAVANSMAASAAYWLASAADEFSVIPSGEVGSIGVLAAHEDQSGEMERRGRHVTLVSAGKYKGEGSPYMPLSDEAKAHIQERVDEYYAMFTRAVARHRRVDVEMVRNGYGEGRTVGARKALDLGMVDHVETLDDAVDRLMARVGRTGAHRPAALADPLDMVAMPCPMHKTASDDGPWDGPANEARMRSGETPPYYHRAYAWQDPAGDPGAKASYRFIHHQVSEDGEPGAANMTACSTGIGVLNGGRGGTTIPMADRRGVHRHLASHMQDAGREAPPMRSEADQDQLEARRRLLTLSS